jgi:hypothetical protein
LSEQASVLVLEWDLDWAWELESDLEAGEK